MARFMSCSCVMSRLLRRNRKQRCHMIDPKLLEILACPACQADVVLKDEKIVCVKCHRKYPIKNGIPVLLADQAEK